LCLILRVMRKIRGFTLIELMVALAISVILIAIGYPAYSSHQAHAERDRAIVALMQLSARMEVYFSDNESYAGATVRILHAANLVDGLHYRLRIVRASDAHYEIEAVPFGVQADRDTQCGTLSLTDTNVRGISGGGDATQCWL